MKVGIWGAGNIAETHAQALKAAGIEVAAVVDIDVKKAEAFAQRYNIAGWGDDPAALLAPEIEAVHVCTPPNLHFQMVSSLLEKGKHVLCEKPLCFENAQAKELARLARARGRVCAINFNVRFHMACQKARRVVADPSFGPVMLIHGNYLQEFNAFPAPLDWRYNPALAGRMRAVTEIGTHWADIAQYISGKKIEAVSAQFGRFNPQRRLDGGVMYPIDSEGPGERFDVSSEDAAAVNLRFSDGAIGSVLLSEVSQGRINRITLEVTGRYGNLWWNSEDNNMLNTARKGGGVNTEVFGFGNGFMDTFRTLIDEYYAAVRAGAQPENPAYPTFDEGAQIVAICNALLESADSDSRWVMVQ